MITAFDMLQLIGTVAGVAAGIALGGRFGIAGTIIGGILGFVVGAFAGRVPWALAWASMRRELQRATVSEPRERAKTEYYFSHLLIAELASRGEPIDDLRSVVAAQLNSDSADVRRFGQANARLWFPDLLNST
jgi:hypothetical protein